jgi:hypothetical protein
MAHHWGLTPVQVAGHTSLRHEGVHEAVSRSENRLGTKRSRLCMYSSWLGSVFCWSLSWVRGALNNNVRGRQPPLLLSMHACMQWRGTLYTTAHSINLHTNASTPCWYAQGPVESHQRWQFPARSARLTATASFVVQFAARQLRICVPDALVSRCCLRVVSVRCAVADLVSLCRHVPQQDCQHCQVARTFKSRLYPQDRYDRQPNLLFILLLCCR